MNDVPGCAACYIISFKEPELCPLYSFSRLGYTSVLIHSLHISRHVKEKNPTILHQVYMIHESEMSYEGGGGKSWDFSMQTPENVQGYNIAKAGMRSTDREQPEWVYFCHAL